MCPFIPTSASSTAQNNTNSSFPFSITPSRNVTVLPMMPTIIVAYNFSSALVPQNEVDITFVMTHNGTDATTPIRLTRGGHDVVSYTLDFWEELDYGLFPSFWRLINPVRHRIYTCSHSSTDERVLLQGHKEVPCHQRSQSIARHCQKYFCFWSEFWVDSSEKNPPRNDDTLPAGHKKRCIRLCGIHRRSLDTP